ncbi:MAG: hypothetical protein IPO53_10610 [Chitinophagaceae bacterium]|nr:hypothetical protein [Chitinophagaceae bacterium]
MLLKRLKAAQDTADLMQDEFCKSFSNKKYLGAYEKNGIKNILSLLTGSKSG